VSSLIALEDVRLAVIGLGYVGLPLAVAFAAKVPTIGYDISERRVAELARFHDRTLEVDGDVLRAAKLTVTTSTEALADRNFFIVTVPTPIDDAKRLDLEPLRRAAREIGAHLSHGAVVVFESTVYPGLTEEECVPLLERASGLVFNRDFFVGYSPERINPGDRLHRLETIVKVVAGSTPEATDLIEAVYATVATAGIYRAASIRIAEAAKVIENTQRDVNIALVNELAILFDRLGIDTLSVLEAAATKWNFLPFRPGLVGGHCIGVDPYYLTFKAQQVGYDPQMILAGRHINDGMGKHVATRLVKAMMQRHLATAGARVLVLGFAFKENCPDHRNTRVVDIVRELAEYGVAADVVDPWLDADDVRREHGIELVDTPPAGAHAAVVLAVAHDRFRALGIDEIRRFLVPNGVVFDVKGMFPLGLCEVRL
jgi:UDP-N-acetyl-D-galactosamine dehydrogenase